MVAGNVTVILIALRALMQGLDLKAYIVPSGDPHHSEYVAPCHERRAYITNFDGSAGTAVVTLDYALVWTDSRYFIQAEEQLKGTEWILMKQGEEGVPTLSTWLSTNLTDGAQVGVDPSLYSKSEWDSLSKELMTFSKDLVPVFGNLVDQIWNDVDIGAVRPNCSSNPIMELEQIFSGKNVSQKLTDVRTSMKASNVDVLVVSELDEVAWLLNLRGSDIPYNPFFFSYVILTNGFFELFINSMQISDDIATKLKVLNGTVYPYETVTSRLKNIVDNSTTGKIWMSKNCNYELVSQVTNDQKQLIKLTPIALMKAIKNNVEATGMMECHIRDASAVIEYLAWLEQQIENGDDVTEISGATMLESLRELQPNYRGLSFSTISASGPNAASPHYSPSIEADRKLSKNEIYLVDSGGQYLDGTTDVTRTIHFGEPSDEIKDAFTRVLKGMISIRTANFPRKSPGNVLDTLGRQYLWEKHQDYGHGTGHGIGMFAGVHEGPFSIGTRTGSDDPGLDISMFTSDEPGYYKPGDFGIRIENIIRVVNATEDNTFITFEDVTLVPISLKLIKPELLTSAEIKYLDEYHEKVKQVVGEYMKKHPHTTNRALEWLDRETRSINSRTSASTLQRFNFNLLLLLTIKALFLCCTIFS